MIKPILAAAAALVAVPALAAPAAPFNGPFVGVQGGWQQDLQRFDVGVGGVDYRDHNRQSGFAYGGQVGWDFRLAPRFVVGVEGSATGRTGSTDFGDGLGNAYRLKDGRTLTASARVGFLVAPETLLYARGGYTNARFIVDAPNDRAAGNRDGSVVGIGLEQALTRSVSARVEYDRSQFGHDYYDDIAASVGADNASARYRRNAVSAGVNLHF